MDEAIRDGVMGSAHRAGLVALGREHSRPAFSRAIARAFADHGPDHALRGGVPGSGGRAPRTRCDRQVIAFPPPNVAEQ
jgi:hypothetical protein